MPASTSQSGYHHGDLRNALLAAGEQLLVKRGVGALSLREVAKFAGVSHAAPYRHFKGKAALMCALAQSGFDRLRSDIRAAAEKIPYDPEQKLVEAGVAYVHLAVRNPELIQLMFGGGFEQPDDLDLKQASMTAFEALVDIISTGIEAGVFRDRDPRELALVAWTSMHGMAMLLAARLIGINLDDEEALDGLVRSVAQNVIYGISR
ncbi:MAG: TetR/AcrR family transcriptional regulator [Gammaproteobacteria bacterium]|nr:TetR/AcrR family transcriptional regulator [Gammaproteobacteria bacterium]